MKTVLECIESGAAYLEGRGIDDARSNMQWLVAKELGCSRMELYVQFDRPLTEEELAPLRDALKRRGAGEPLQHLLGTVEFHGREFLCDARALVPRPETEELVEQILKRTFPRPARVLDMGTGSGVLGLSLAAALGEDCREAVLADLSGEALKLAGENSVRLGLKARLCESDLFENVEGSFHLIAANLPYVAVGEREKVEAEVHHDPEVALYSGADGLDTIRRFLPQAAAQLEPDGLLAMEVGYDQCPAVVPLMGECGLRDASSALDLSGNPRFVFASGPATN